MDKKIMVTIIACVLAMTVPIYAVAESDGSEVSVSHGEFDVYIQSSTSTDLPNFAGLTSQWLKYDVAGYDACKAIMNVNSGLAESTYTINSTYNMWVPTEGENGYWDVDPNYGKIDKFLNLSSTGDNTWHAWVYTYDLTDKISGNEIWSWKSVNTSGLGHYRPFTDYVNSNETANVALYYGTTAQANSLTLPSNPSQQLVDIADMKANGVADYQVTIKLIDKSGDQPVSVIDEQVCYGSDIYAALKDACSSNGKTVVGNDNAGPYYSWLTSIDGKANATASPWVPYWAFFDNTGATPNYTAYVSGYYSPLSEGYNTSNSVLFVYGAGSP